MEDPAEKNIEKKNRKKNDSETRSRTKFQWETSLFLTIKSPEVKQHESCCCCTTA